MNDTAVATVTGQTTHLVHYDAMCRAIAEAHAVDEVKDIRDRALALQTYARLAKNVDAEAKACEIRLRAERRAGQMLADMEKAKGAREPGTERGTTPSYVASASNARPLAEIGISYDQSSRWQKLAAIPDADFEHTFAQPERKPSTTGIIAAHKAKSAPPAPPPPAVVPVDPHALWLGGNFSTSSAKES